VRYVVVPPLFAQLNARQRQIRGEARLLRGVCRGRDGAGRAKPPSACPFCSRQCRGGPGVGAHSAGRRQLCAVWPVKGLGAAFGLDSAGAAVPAIP